MQGGDTSTAVSQGVKGCRWPRSRVSAGDDRCGHVGAKGARSGGNGYLGHASGVRLPRAWLMTTPSIAVERLLGDAPVALVGNLLDEVTFNRCTRWQEVRCAPR